MKLRDWWLNHAPWPLWTLASCKPFSPWCLVDDLCHAWFPMTFGNPRLGNYPDPVPRICRRHDGIAERYDRKKHPEYFDE